MIFYRLLMATWVVLGLLLIATPAMNFPIPVMLGAFLIAKHYKPRRKPTSLGDAEFATEDDLSRRGMLDTGNGLCVGVIQRQRPKLYQALGKMLNPRVSTRDACEYMNRSLNKRLQRSKVRLNQAVHTVIFSMTGGGKGVFCYIPFGLECPHSIFSVDTKDELFTKTAHVRRAMGSRIIHLAPLSGVTGDALNPLWQVDPQSPLAVDRMRSIAADLILSSGQNNQYWDDLARTLFTGYGCFLLTLDRKYRTLQAVREIAVNAEYRAKCLASTKASTQWGGMLSALAHQLLGMNEKEFNTAHSVLAKSLDVFDSPPVRAATETSNFDPKEVRTTFCTVYVCIPPAFLESHGAIQRVWLGELMRACVDVGIDETQLVYFCLDEAASFPRMQVLESAVDKMRGYGVRLILGYQSMGQLKSCWREGLEVSLLSNCTKVYFAINDLESAKTVSEMLGDETIYTSSFGSNTGYSNSANTHQGGGSVGNSGGSNQGYQEAARRLMRPEELMKLPRDIAITIAPSMPPIMTVMVPYYAPQSDQPSRWRTLKKHFDLLIWSTVPLALLLALGEQMATPYLSPRNLEPCQRWVVHMSLSEALSSAVETISDKAANGLGLAIKGLNIAYDMANEGHADRMIDLGRAELGNLLFSGQAYTPYGEGQMEKNSEKEAGLGQAIEQAATGVEPIAAPEKTIEPMEMEMN